VRRLGHFGFNVTKIEECTHFYSDLLGFKISDEGPFGGGAFMRFGNDHHAFAMFNRKAMEERAAASGQARPGGPDQTINQITWQTQSLNEPVHAVDYLAERGIQLSRTGRDGAGSNWATYFFDPDGHVNELYYGIEQIGWDGYSKPAEYRRPEREKVKLPVKSELDEIQESLATGVPPHSGHRHVETMPPIYEVGGIMLPRPFKIVKHGPVNIFVEDVARSTEFYVREVGFDVVEEATWQGERCAFLRCNSEHHSLGLFPRPWRERLGLSPHTTCMSFGIQVADYQQLKNAISFLRDNGVRVETTLIPPELYPGIDYSAHCFDPDGHCIQLYYYMEQIGWDGRPRPKSARRQVDPNSWPDTLEPLSDTFRGEPFLGPWG
jgi:catechol 2,3-dioxygenase-like lactoylglutathione lyase family enzyme